MTREIKKVAVLGAGVMGAGIAAHLAGTGIPSLLLDIVPKDLPPGGDRNAFAKKGLETILTSKPSLIYSKADAKLIELGNFEDDFGRLQECDWIVEVVVERLDIKKSVFERVEKAMRPGAIVSSNTSGLPLAAMSEGRSVAFRKNFVVTHFFNPVRYMKLVELVTGPETDPEVTHFIADFLVQRLGKGVVYAKDTPNFVANRIGIYGMFSALRLVLESYQARSAVEGEAPSGFAGGGGDASPYNPYKVEEVDKILGPAIGRPKSAMFRTVDLVGLDTLIHVARNTYENCPRDDEREIFRLPPVLEKMAEKKLLGDKTGAGFYKKVKSPDGKSEILALDLSSLEYRPQEKVRYDSLGAVKDVEDPGERLKTMVAAKDRAGELAWKTTRNVLLYAANRIPEIADDVVNIDNGMKWGFNWDIGPFETWDRLGVRETADRIRAEGGRLPPLIEQVLSKGEGRFYKKEDGRAFYFDAKSSSYRPVPEPTGVLLLRGVKERTKVIRKNDGASLWDVGDGVAALEFHTKMNAIDADVGQMMNAAVEEVEKNFQGLLLFNEGQNFSVGANLMLLYLEAQQKNWKGIEEMVRGFQAACMRLRYSKKPVVAAPHQMALGGGCEVSLGADAIHAHAELYMGLVEVGVGLIPAGGGCKEMLLRWQERMEERFAKMPKEGRWARRIDGGPFPKTQKAFEAIAFAKVSMSAKEAIEIGYMRNQPRSGVEGEAPRPPQADVEGATRAPINDWISISRDHHLSEAKQTVLALAKGYQPPKPREDILVAGRGGYYALRSAVDGFLARKMVSEHDAVLAMKLANILTGGDTPNMALVTEQRILDLELEAFLELCGMEKTQERIQHMLMKGKPLRN